MPYITCMHEGCSTSVSVPHTIADDVNFLGAECAECQKKRKKKGSMKKRSKHDCCYESLTVQALRMRREVFGGGGIDLDTFDRVYLDATENGLGEYERKMAKKHHISVMVHGKNPKQVQGG